MRHPIISAGLLFVILCISPAFADPLFISTKDIELASPWGATLVDAIAEAKLQAETCAKFPKECSSDPLSPRQLVPESEPCGSQSNLAAWRHANELTNGQNYVAYLQRLTRARKIFDCIDSRCLVLINTSTPDERENSVKTVSVCQVQMVNGVPGAPSRCQEALKEHARSGSLIRGQVGHFFTSCSMGLRDFDAIFVDRAHEVALVRKLVGEVLRAKPFNLAVMEDGKALVGTRAQLASDVLTGWREWVTVRVDIDTRGNDAGTTIFTTMLVSKQASSNREAWTPPSESQEATYILTLRNAFERGGATLSTGGSR